MKFVHYFLISCFLITTSSCEEIFPVKEDGDGEKASLSMYVDGEQWIASSANGAHAPVMSVFSNNEVQIEGFLNTDNGDSFTIVVKVENDFGGTGTYWKNVSAYYFSDIKDGPYKVYDTEAEGGNSAITFTTFDEEKGLASGTFTCRVYHEGSKMMITKGEFKNLRIDYIN